MLHLKTGVHLEEIEVPVFINDKFDRTRAAVIHSLRQGNRLLPHLLAGCFVQKRTWRFFNNLLITPLNGAFTFTHINRILAVSKHLNFDVAWLGHKLFDEDAIITKTRLRFIHGRLEAFSNFRIAPGDTHTLSATACRRLDHDRKTDLAGNLPRFFSVFDDTEIARDRVDLRRVRKFLGLDLVAHHLNGFDVWTDKGDAFLLQHFSEGSIL